MPRSRDLVSRETCSGSAAPCRARITRQVPRPTPAMGTVWHDLKTAASRDRALQREILVVIALTAVGAVVRLWSLGRLGLVHFDEGIYALAGLWVFSPRGLAGIDPAFISYAPPGFPVLIGLVLPGLGRQRRRGDSGVDRRWHADDPGRGLVVAPDVRARSRGRGRGLRRTFGTACRFFANGPDRCFVSLVLALSPSARASDFSSGPICREPSLLGLAVGLSQLFKYNGWISGVIVALTAAVWLLCHRREWRDEGDGRHLGMGTLGGDRRGRRLLAVVSVRRFAWRLRGAPGPPAKLPGRPFVVAGHCRSSSPRPMASRAARSGLRCGGLAAALAHVDQRRGLRRTTVGSSRRALVETLGSHGPLRDHRDLVVGRPGLDLARVCCRTAGLATNRRYSSCVGWVALSVSDAVLSSLRPALAADRGVRLALHGRAVRRDSIETSRSPAKAHDGPGIIRRILLPWFALVCIVGAICARSPRTSGRKSHACRLAGTERLAAAGVTVDPERAARRT